MSSHCQSFRMDPAAPYPAVSARPRENKLTRTRVLHLRAVTRYPASAMRLTSIVSASSASSSWMRSSCLWFSPFKSSRCCSICLMVLTLAFNATAVRMCRPVPAIRRRFSAFSAACASTHAHVDVTRTLLTHMSSSPFQLPHKVMFLVQHGTHMVCSRARERAKAHWKCCFSSTFLQLPTACCSRNRPVSRAEVPIG